MNSTQCVIDKYKTCNICISGDFNLPNINWLIHCPINNDEITIKFVSCVFDNGLSHKTRRSDTLDLNLYRNFSSLIDAKVIEPLVNSGHKSIEHRFDLSYLKNLNKGETIINKKE